MDFSRPLVRGTLLRRYKRFLADVRLESGEEVTAHCPNPGSMASCMAEGCEVLLSDHEGSKRKLRYGWELSRMSETWVLVNTAMSNGVVREGIEGGAVPELAGYASLRPEVKVGKSSRIDFLLADPGRPDCWVEVKQATLEHRGVSYFPDAVTTRGTRHLQELAGLVRRGSRGVLLFLVARGDTSHLRPAALVDPDYAACLRAAARAGVEILAYRGDASPHGVALGEPVPIELGEPGDEEGPLPRGKTKANRARGGWEIPEG